jgi:hypothetical protein
MHTGWQKTNTDMMIMTATDQNEPEPDWRIRCQIQNNQEWQISQELLELGRTLLGLARQEPHSAAFLIQVHRLLELGTDLGRRSADSALAAVNVPEVECRKCCAAREQWEAALKKVYGQNDAEIVSDSLDQSSTPSLSAAPSPQPQPNDASH